MFVIGGANSAGQAAMFFARYATKVTMLVRGSALSKGISHYLVEQISGTKKIEALARTAVVEAHGEDRLETVTFKNRDTGEIETRDVPERLFG